MKKLIIAVIFLSSLSAQSYAAAVTTPAPSNNSKTEPYNGSYNGNYNTPKPSYYENGMPVYVNNDEQIKRREAALKARRQQQQNNNSTNQGVVN